MKKKEAITTQDLTELKSLWATYRQDRKTYRLTRLNLGRMLHKLQTERAKPGKGDFVSFIHEKVGIQTSTAYDLMNYFKRVNNIVEVTERIATAAADCEVDLTATKMKPALKKCGSQLKSADSLPEVREVLQKIADYKPRKVKPDTKTKEALVGLSKGKALQAVQQYLDNFSGETLKAKWSAFVEEISSIQGWTVSTGVVTEKGVSIKKPIKADLMNAPVQTVRGAEA